MKNFHFYKYQGTGNDFVIIDNRDGTFPSGNRQLISTICHRRFGIGADGLILIENEKGFDFRMVFFNPDSTQSMCGNGGRCVVALAHKLGIIGSDASFVSFDGFHKAIVHKGDVVSIKMNDVSMVEKNAKYTRLNTGSPHHVQLQSNLDDFDVYTEGSKIRYSFGVEGINVNFVEQIQDNRFKVRTYERGVENETYSCGTGATAVAIAMNKTGKTSSDLVVLETKGGTLEVSFTVKTNFFGMNKKYEDVWLKGSAVLVYEGDYKYN